MNMRRASNKAIKEQRQRERADEVVNGAILCFLGLVVLTMLAGCGASGEQSSTWNVATNSENALERSRAWEICGGTISCSYTLDMPPKPDKTMAGGFIGSATVSQTACYEQYSGSNDVAEATGRCR
jgi:hypothetical protein